MSQASTQTVTVQQLLVQQWQLLCRDRWLLSLLTWLPMVVFLLVWWIFSAGLTRELPIAVVDLDHSQISRTLQQHYDASPSLKVISVTNEITARSMLRRADVSALVIIPEGLEKQVKLARPPKVAAYYNSQFMVLGKQINSALQQAHGTFNAKIEVAKKLSAGNTQMLQAMSAAVPIRNQISALYNGNSNYAQFIVSAALPAFWQVLIVVVTIFALGAELKDQRYNSWLGQQALSKISVKLLFFGALLWLQGILLCTLMFHVFDWPMRGSWSILLLGMLLCIMATQTICLVFMLLFQDMSRALSFAGALTAPSFAFMGISFPVTDMPQFAQFWRQLIPITQYIELQVSQANYGAHVSQALPQLSILLLFSSGFLFAAYLVKRRFSLPLNAEPLA